MKKRLVLSLMTVAVVALLASGATFALFTAETSNAENTFTAGTVAINDPLETSVDIGPMAPGDSGDVGDWTVTYSGNLDAWLGLTASTSGDLFTGEYPVEITISNNSGDSYDVDGTKQVLGEFTENETITLDVDYSWNVDADNTYKNADGELQLQVFAVQSKNNTNSDGTGPSSWN
ncbi:MAG: M73 family metallopeptidase [Clostridiales bacterium]|nr:M73 family metallopeptidase [Clostridiales bacterium]MCF8022573.1 M73 family metallopeptidase [Clostridiales bacterium]